MAKMTWHFDVHRHMQPSLSLSVSHQTSRRFSRFWVGRLSPSTAPPLPSRHCRLSLPSLPFAVRFACAGAFCAASNRRRRSMCTAAACSCSSSHKLQPPRPLSLGARRSLPRPHLALARSASLSARSGKRRCARAGRPPYLEGVEGCRTMRPWIPTAHRPFTRRSQLSVVLRCYLDEG